VKSVVDVTQASGYEILQVVDIFDNDGTIRTYQANALEKVQ